MVQSRRDIQMKWEEVLKKDKLMREPKTPQESTTTTPSTGQDEEAAKRTEDKEAELLAMIRERNRKARQG